MALKVAAVYRHSYYAFGLGASSYLDGTRFTRPCKLKQWEEYVSGLAGHTPSGEMQACATGSEPTDPSDRLLDAVMLSLRLQRGLDLQWTAKHWGEECVRQILNAIPSHIVDGRAELVSRDGRIWSAEHVSDALTANSIALRLTDPHGFLTSNDIISDVFLQIDEAAYTQASR